MVTGDRGGTSDAVEVIYRQDAAFGADRVDFEMWLSTLFFPLIMWTGGDSMIVRTPEQAAALVRELESLARADGCCALRSRILSNIQPAEDLAIVGGLRDRVTGDGEVIATTSTTWTLVRQAGEWLISQILFEDSKDDPSVTALWRGWGPDG